MSYQPCPRRLSCQGKFRVDILIMILMILAVIAAGITAMVMFDEYQNDQLYLARMEALREQHKAEWSTVEKVAVRSSAQLGFRSAEGGMASLDAIQSLFYMTESHQPKYWGLSENSLNDGRGQGLSAPKKLDANEDEALRDSSNEIRKEAYFQSDQTLRELIFRQDAEINRAIEYVKRIADRRKKEKDYLKDSREARSEVIDTKVSEAEVVLETADSELKDKHDEQQADEAEETEAIKTSEATLRQMDDEKDERQTLVQKERLGIKDGQVDAGKARNALLTILANRVGPETDNNDFDGFVVQVDESSGWVWISLGQPDNVRTEMTFQVVRPTQNASSYLPVAEIRVKEVLPGGISRCRIDALEDVDNMPRGGDLIRNALYSSRQYVVFAFLGQFGAPHTKYSKQQLSDLLHRFNKVVLPKPDENVEVIILGGEYWDDENFIELERARIAWEAMGENDLLYMFGVAGPDAGN